MSFDLADYTQPSCYLCGGSGRVRGFGATGKPCPCIAVCKDCDNYLTREEACDTVRCDDCRAQAAIDNAEESMFDHTYEHEDHAQEEEGEL